MLHKNPVKSPTEVANERRAIVGAMARTGKGVSEIVKAVKNQGIVNPKTGKAYSRQTILSDMAYHASITSQTRSRPLSETIGVWSYVKPYWNARVLLNVDTSFKDYIFYDSLRRGQAAGLQISGPSFCLPAVQTITSYCFGKGVNAHLMESAIPQAETKAVHETNIREANGKPTQNKKNALGGGKISSLNILPKPKPVPNATDRVAWTNLQLSMMLRRNMGFFVAQTIELLSLGNVYIIINPDCTFSVASPETVTVEYSASDYRRVLRVIITTKMQNAKVQDVYTDDKRVLTVNYYDKDKEPEVYEYENLIGRIPIVHWTNDRTTNEIYGRPIYEAGLPVMYMYDALIQNIMEGVTLLGTPIPSFENLDDPTATKQANSTPVPYTDEAGNQQTEWVLNMNRQTGLFLGKGGQSKMLSTNVGFTKDSLDSLRQLFLLWLNQTHIPELIWGGAIAASKASTDSQMPPFIQYINMRRLMLEGQGADAALGIEARGGLLEVIDLWLRTYKLLNPDIVVAPVKLEWPEIDLVGDQWKYMWGSFLRGTGDITPETAVKMSGYVDDPAGEVMKAAGKQPRVPQFDDYDEKLRDARLKAAKASGEPPDPNEIWSSDYTSIMLDQKGGNTVLGQPLTTKPDPGHEGEASDPSPDREWQIIGPLAWFNMLGSSNN